MYLTTLRPWFGRKVPRIFQLFLRMLGYFTGYFSMSLGRLTSIASTIATKARAYTAFGSLAILRTSPNTKIETNLATRTNDNLQRIKLTAEKIITTFCSRLLFPFRVFLAEPVLIRAMERKPVGLSNDFEFKVVRFASMVTENTTKANAGTDVSVGALDSTVNPPKADVKTNLGKDSRTIIDTGRPTSAASTNQITVNSKSPKLIAEKIITMFRLKLLSLIGAFLGKAIELGDYFKINTGRLTSTDFTIATKVGAAVDAMTRVSVSAVNTGTVAGTVAGTVGGARTGTEDAPGTEVKTNLHTDKSTIIDSDEPTDTEAHLPNRNGYSPINNPPEAHIKRDLIWKVVKIYYSLIIPHVYLRDALEDAKDVITTSESLRVVIKEVYEYTRGAVGFRLTQIEETYLQGEFHIKNLLGLS